jgi:hypothetical protein
MTLEKYDRASWGKLTRQIHVTVDEEFFLFVETCKGRGFNFNAWARDALAAGLPELKTYLEESKDTKSLAV